MGALLGLTFVLLCLSSTYGHLVVAGSNSGSVLQALLESRYSEWMELVERGQVLHPLEQLVASGDELTIFAPQNHQLNPQIKAFLLKPSNAHLLRKMVEYHVLSQRVTAAQWRNTTVTSLAADPVSLTSVVDQHGVMKLCVGEAEVVAPDVIVRADGVVHGVDQMLLPLSLQQEYVAFTTRKLATPLPTGAPGLDARRAILLEHEHKNARITNKVALVPAISPVTAPSPFMAPAPGPSLGPSAAPLFALGEEEVFTFITALNRFGGYSEFAGLLMDLTTLGSEISKLVNEGYKLTILAPDDKAWTNALTADQLNSQTAIESILHYHILTEYQTEESLYSTLRRNGKTSFVTLSVPLTLSAHEVDGQVVFGEGDREAGVFDHDIHADGFISVQGINKVLIPPGTADKNVTSTIPTETKRKPRTLLDTLRLSTSSWRVGSGGSARSVVTGSRVVSAVVTSVVLLMANSWL